MDGEDPFSIARQIGQMLEEDMTYRVVNECCRLAPSSPRGDVHINGMIHELIDSGYFWMQPLRIRRLCDENPGNPKNSVISLRRLLNDIDGNGHLYTRGNVFEAEGLSYDCSAVRERAREHSMQQLLRWRATGVAAFSDSEIMKVAEIPERLHADFDRMSGTTPATRQPSDTLRKGLLQWLKEKLDICHGVRAYVNKFVAHAADPANRNRGTAEEICLDRVWKCHEAICYTASFVSVYILRGPSTVFMPTLDFDPLQHIEGPWISPEDMHKLRSVIDNQYEQVSKWCGAPWTESRPNFGQ